jgi:hypothetical protein
MITEADTCRKYVLPKLNDAGWDNEPHSFTEQKTFTDGRIVVIGDTVRRSSQKRADYLLRYTRDFLIGVVEAKPAYKSLSGGLQQAKDYASVLGLKFAYSTNGQMNKNLKGNLDILDKVLTLRPRSGPSFPCLSEGPGIPVIMPSALGGYRYDKTKEMYGNGTEKLAAEDILQADDLLISRGNKRDQVGLCIVFPGSEETKTYANLLMRMRLKAEVLPQFAKYWIMSPLAVNYIRQHTKGTSPSVQKINQRALINLPFPIGLDIEEQRRWIHRLDAIFMKVEEIETQVRNQFEDLQLLPDSILTAAFKGLV